MINSTQIEVAEKPFAAIAGANAAFEEIAGEIEENQSSDVQSNLASEPPMNDVAAAVVRTGLRFFFEQL